jgi:hypothetical protein
MAGVWSQGSGRHVMLKDDGRFYPKRQASELDRCGAVGTQARHRGIAFVDQGSMW